jgi:hypothetical protein
MTASYVYKMRLLVLMGRGEWVSTMEWYQCWSLEGGEVGRLGEVVGMDDVGVRRLRLELRPVVDVWDEG